MERIQQLWQKHRLTPFPDQCRGSEVANCDLVLLDAHVDGCISTFLEARGHLDVERTAVLGLMYRDLGAVIPQLDAGAIEYFHDLELLARLTLEALCDNHDRA